MVVWQRANKIYIHHDQLTGVDMTFRKFFGCTLSLARSSATFQYHLWIWIFTSLFEGKKIDRSKASTSCITQYTCLRIFSVWNSAFQFNLVSYKYWTGTYVECFHILKFDLVVFDAPEMAISDKMFETCMCKHLRISWIMAMT